MSVRDCISRKYVFFINISFTMMWQINTAHSSVTESSKNLSGSCAISVLYKQIVIFAIQLDKNMRIKSELADVVS